MTCKQNKRTVGKKLEYIVADFIKPIDGFARPTKNSGASNELGDVANRYFVVECKNWNKENIIIQKKVWEHLIRSIPLHSTRIPILVQKNSEGKIFVSMTIGDFFDIVYQAKKPTS